ncbi:hypothetical protein A5717_11620 [Mycolicibacterium porcinum]|nr:hypothetical protein A5717_11620 [Mycolicibacterium porcinum]
MACVAPELIAGHDVVYVHYEEADPGSTIERLRLLGVADTVMQERLHFVGPACAVRREWLAELLALAPTLAVHDGVNEAMSLHGAEIMAADGASEFRRRLIVPFLTAGAATIACDHLPLVRDGSRRDAYGSVHKGNALNGARLALENVEPFGRGMRGVSHVFVTKDRPGQLRAHGRPTKTPGKTYVGTLVADDSQPFEPFSLMLYYAPPEPDDQAGLKMTVTSAELAEIVYDVLAALPDHAAESQRKLFAHVRAAGHSFRTESLRQVLDDLIVAGRVNEVQGPRGAKGYQAVVTASQESDS